MSNVSIHDIDTFKEEVFQQLNSLRLEVRRNKREIRRLRKQLIEEIGELGRSLESQVEEICRSLVEEEETGVTATTCESGDEEIEAEYIQDYMKEHDALKEQFKISYAKKLGHRPTTPEIRHLATQNGGSVTVFDSD